MSREERGVMDRAEKEIRLPASMDVEASYVMTMVILALAVLIRAAYAQCSRTVRVMYLHRAVEQMRCREGAEGEETLAYGTVWKGSGKVKGTVKSEIWEKEITAGIHEPEEFLRTLTIFVPEEGGGRDGDTVYQRDEAELSDDHHGGSRGAGL